MKLPGVLNGQRTLPRLAPVQNLLKLLGTQRLMRTRIFGDMHP